jgi:hypothetical protein
MDGLQKAGEEIMETWRLAWCFYNSINVTTVVLLGTIIFVVPALFTLPSELKPQLGELHTDYLELREARTKTIWLGALTTGFAFLAIMSYACVLSQTDGETCKVTVATSDNIYYSLNALYLFTGFVLFLFGFFYTFLQDTKKKHEALKREMKEQTK